ncbi:hypothetical protein [Haloarchaeobius sp. DFWS5]|uniref:hypothetical protein n=1 Tax=Haloarchaeobius sp. DFWS5 TaxID=3446114 RepID=UPI003EBFF9E2
MRRRALLTSVSVGLVGSAGCLGLDDAGTTTTTRSRTPADSSPPSVTGTAPTESAIDTVSVGAGDTLTFEHGSVTLGDLVAQSSFRRQTAVVPSIHGDPDQLFAVLDIDISQYDEAVAELPTMVVVDGSTNPAGEQPLAYTTSGADSVRLAFSVPAGEPADAGGIVFFGRNDRYRYSFPESLVAAIEQPPAFDVSVSFPDSVGLGARYHAEVTVSNTGERPGTLQGCLSDSRSPDACADFQVSVDAGASTTTTVEGGHARGDPGELTLTVDWGLDSASKTVPAESSGTTTDE